MDLAVGRPIVPAHTGRSREHAPGEEAIVDQIVQGILNEVCEYFDFDDEDRTA